MPTDYTPNGRTQFAGITWDDTCKWLLNVLPTGQLVIVLNSQQASPVESLSVDGSTGAVTLMDTVTNTSMRVPVYTTATLPSAATAGRLIYTSDDGNLRISSASAWVILAASGGTGVTASGNLDANQIVIGAGTTVLQKLGASGTTTTVLHGNAAGAPTFGAVGLTTDVTGTLPVGSGGTGATTLTSHGFLYGAGAGAVTASAEPTDGQLPIGSTGNTPVIAGLTAGTGITVTNAPGSITIASTASGALDKVTSATTVSNTAVETTIYTKSIAGNTITSSGKLRLTLLGTITDTTTGATATITYRLKFGGTTLATVAVNTSDTGSVSDSSPATTTQNRNIGSAAASKVAVELVNLGATNSQFGELRAHQLAAHVLTGSAANAASQAWTDSVIVDAPLHENKGAAGTAAIDTTGAATLLITAQWSGASPSRSYTMKYASLELLT